MAGTAGTRQRRVLLVLFGVLALTAAACGGDAVAPTEQGRVVEFGQSVPSGGGMVQSFVLVEADDGEELTVWLPDDDAVWRAMSAAAETGSTTIEYEKDGDVWVYVGVVDEEAETAVATAVTTTTAPGSTTTALAAPTECPPPAGVTTPVRAFSEAPPTCIDPTKQYTAVFDTSEGEIRVDLDARATPDTVNNFVVLSRYGYYDDTAIFRTDPSIGIIQGGGRDNTAEPGYTIPDEGDGYTYEPGQLVMARTSQPDSAGGQFFFVGDVAASSLDADGSYVVFGTTDGAGLAVVRSILDLHEDQPDNPLGGAPSRPVTVNSVTIEES